MSQFSQNIDFVKNPLIISLDVDEPQQAMKLAQDLKDFAGCYKLGPRLVLREKDLVQKISKIAPVFLDFKFFDIASTMVSSIAVAAEMGASLVTVHALSGNEALAAVAAEEKKINKVRPFKVLAVTILTSWEKQNFPPSFKDLSVDQHVVSLADLTLSSGLSGLVCSGHELDLLKTKDLFKVTPGIRLQEKEAGSDQKRVMGPREAIEKGAGGIVVGRPIIGAADPVRAARDFYENIMNNKA
jgi:orotidine-5'-phosphate decarboxylase